ncbi:MAG TPA: DUF1328 domain-containing protein [Methylophilus sp.]
MLYYAIVFFLISIVAGWMGFGGVASGAATIARVCFFIFLLLAIVVLVATLLGVGLFA